MKEDADLLSIVRRLAAEYDIRGDANQHFRLMRLVGEAKRLLDSRRAAPRPA